MMTNGRIRAILAVAAVLLPAVQSAEAGKVLVKAPCRVLVDQPGDSEGGESLDLISADLGSNATHITAVIRVKALTRSNAEAPTGQAFYVEWTVPGAAQPLFLAATVSPTREWFEFGHTENIYRPDGGATGFFDEARSEVRVTAPLSAWADRAKLRKGTRLGSIKAATYRFVGVTVGELGAGSLQPGDVGVTRAVHVVGTVTCVAVGR